MENYLKYIEKKLKDKIKLESIEIINNTAKHKGHKFFSENKYHLHLKIKSLYLKSITRIDAQKLIMNIFYIFLASTSSRFDSEVRAFHGIRYRIQSKVEIYLSNGIANKFAKDSN